MGKIFKFYFIAIAFSWSFWCLSFFLDKSFSPFLHIIGSLGPAISALIILKLNGLKNEFLIKLNSKIIFWTALPFLIYVISALYLILFQGKTINFELVANNVEFSAYPKWLYWFFCIIFFGCGEEFGWRRILTPYLDSKFGYRLSVCFFVALWSLWHLPLFWITPGYKSMGLGAILGWIFSLWAGATILQKVHCTTQSIFAVAIFHGLMDIFFNSSSPDGVMMIMGAIVSFFGIIIVLMPTYRN